MTAIYALDEAPSRAFTGRSPPLPVLPRGAANGGGGGDPPRADGGPTPPRGGDTPPSRHARRDRRGGRHQRGAQEEEQQPRGEGGMGAQPRGRADCTARVGAERRGGGEGGGKGASGRWRGGDSREDGGERRRPAVGTGATPPQGLWCCLWLPLTS